MSGAVFELRASSSSRISRTSLTSRTSLAAGSADIGVVKVGAAFGTDFFLFFFLRRLLTSLRLTTLSFLCDAPLERKATRKNKQSPVQNHKEYLKGSKL
jgi:hypothetical protein